MHNERRGIKRGWWRGEEAIWNGVFFFPFIAGVFGVESFPSP